MAQACVHRGATSGQVEGGKATKRLQGKENQFVIPAKSGWGGKDKRA